MIIKKLIFYVLCFFILYLSLNIFITPSKYYKVILDTLSVWLYKVVPPIFLMYLITTLIISFNLSYYISIIFYPLRKIFKFETNEGFTLYLLSHFLSNPGLLLICKERFNKNQITQHDYRTLIACASNISFLYVFSLFLERNTSFVIYISIVLANFIICLFSNRNNKVNKHNIFTKNEISFSKMAYSFSQISNFSYIILSIAIYMVTSSVFITSISNTPLTKLSFIMDLPYGSQLIVSQKMPLYLLVILFSFQGLTMHMQVIPIIKRNYYHYLLYRIIALILALAFYFSFA